MCNYFLLCIVLGSNTIIFVLSVFRQSSHWPLQAALANLVSDLIYQIVSFLFILSIISGYHKTSRSKFCINIWSFYAIFTCVWSAMSRNSSCTWTTLWDNFCKALFCCGEIISLGYCLEIFLTALENGINIRGDQCLCSLFCEKTKSLWRYSLQFWISQDPVWCSSREI